MAVLYEQEVPGVLKSMAEAHQVMDSQGFDRTICHLMRLCATVSFPTTKPGRRPASISREAWTSWRGSARWRSTGNQEQTH